MRKVKKGELLETVRNGSEENREVYAMLLSLEIGEQAVVLKKDWKSKKVGFDHAIYAVKSVKRQFSARKLLNEDGWLVTRVQKFNPSMVKSH